MAGCIYRNLFVNLPAILFILSGLILATELELYSVHAAEVAKGVVTRGPVVGKVCPLFCYKDVIYSTCRHGKRLKHAKKVLKSYCNCCLLKTDYPYAKGCKLHLRSGKVVHC